MEYVVPVKRKADEMIQCICNLDTDDGSPTATVTCQVCSCRAHAACFRLVDGHIPDKWKCHRCHPRLISPVRISTTGTGQNNIRSSPPVALLKRRRLSLVDEQDVNRIATPTPVSAPSRILRGPKEVEDAPRSREHDSAEGEYKNDDRRLSTSIKMPFRAQKTHDVSVDDETGPSSGRSAREQTRGEAKSQNTPASASRLNILGEQHGVQVDDGSSFIHAPLSRTLVGRSDTRDSDARGFFANSQNLVINNPVMYDIKTTKVPVLRWLGDSGFLMRGAEFDSDARDPPPRCHPGTRLDLLQTITEWFNNLDCRRHLLWMKGPAAVGKTSIIQTLAEKLWVDKKLGASLFFSRPNGRTNPSFVFPTIAYQFAVRIPYYREYLEQKMKVDPKMLEKTLDDQFRMLVVEPFSTMEKRIGRLAVLIDGLDECKGQGPQSRIIKLISEFTLSSPDSPLIWVIASRPEYHLTTTFQSTGILDAVRVLEVPVNSDEACQDVEKFIRAQFQEICEKYPDDIPPGAQWPVERDVTLVCKASSGHFGFAATIGRFIGDEDTSDPIHQLAIVLSIADHPHIDPLASLHSLYIKILDSVPKHLLPHLKLLLSSYLTPVRLAFIMHPLVFAATIFNLKQHTVYAALRKLHSVIRVPSIKSSGRQSIEFYHASFTDFLCDASKSGDYALDIGACYTKLWKSCFAIASEYLADDSVPILLTKLAWDAPSTFSESDSTIKLETLLYERVTSYFVDHLTTCWDGLPHPLIPMSQSELQNVFETINFSRIQHIKDFEMLSSELVEFYTWLCDEAPEVLLSSNLVTQVRLGDFDLTRISSAKITLQFGYHFQKNAF